VPVILNPAPASRELDIAYACQCDFFMPNETELEILTGMAVDSEAHILAAGRSLLYRGLKNLIITMGHRGSMWLSGDSVHRVDAIPVNAVDTSGAGDAYIGCFAHYFVGDGDVKRAMTYASAYAAYSVRSKGTQRSYADAAQFQDFLATLHQE